jgi:hypothetical protein
MHRRSCVTVQQADSAIERRGCLPTISTVGRHNRQFERLWWSYFRFSRIFESLIRFNPRKLSNIFFSLKAHPRENP